MEVLYVVCMSICFRAMCVKLTMFRSKKIKNITLYYNTWLRRRTKNRAY
jgi:hypothetical protein